MKKFIKRSLVMVVAVFALVGFCVSAAAAAGYIEWNGTGSYRSILVTLQEITNTGKVLKEDRDVYKRKSADLENQVKDKNNQIEAIKKENETLKNDQGKLQQAETDMRDVDQKAKDALNSLK